MAERLCRYISRPAVKRRDEGDDVQAEPEMRAPIVLEPLDFIARLAALVPPPRVHLTRFHGVFAAHATLRAAITPAGRGPGAQQRAAPPQASLF